MMRFAVVGNGKMASEILKLLAATQEAEPVLALADPAKETAQSTVHVSAKKLSIQYMDAARLSEPTVQAALKAAAPDYIVSANNFLLFHKDTLSIPSRGVINFHNGPLPRYGGLDACSWALFNGEARHGVTWHLVDEGIDTGPVLGQRCFDISENETAIGLIARCIRDGVELFRELLPGILADTIEPIPQPADGRLYYGRYDRPFEGWLPWWDGVDAVARVARALSFAPVPNLFYRPRIAWEGGECFAEMVAAPAGEAADAGVVCEITDGVVVIGLGDTCVQVADLRYANGNALALSDSGLKVGTRLVRPAWR